jgi:hypothetical protein
MRALQEPRAGRISEGAEVTTTIILLMYLADVVGGLSVICLIGIFACALPIASLCVPMLIDGLEAEEVKWAKARAMLIYPLLAFCLVGALLPGKTTIYSAAALLVGEKMVDTEEFTLIREVLRKELRKLAQPEQKK